MQNVVVPKPEKFQANFYNAQEAEDLLRAAKGSVLEQLIYVTLIYGLRRSEVLGLKWDSIDFVGRTLTIKHTVVHGFTIVQKNKTKNQSSMRTYPLLEPVETLLLELIKKKAKQKREHEADYIESDYVFTWPDGRPIRPDYISSGFQKILKYGGLRPIRFHDLRHSCASILIAMGYSLKDIQEWLGHSDIKMTGNIYGHLESVRKLGMGQDFVQKFAGGSAFLVTQENAG